ncbi:hypothetical protein, partial [Oceanicola sp. S124]|uniref:hypothetical protein n=1 Tax=Oceanicola sp. S124 TaxID=1042378 RepID=UPI0002559A4F
SPASGRISEDAFGFRLTRSGFHLWVIDGATSLAGEPARYRPDMTDPAWFARRLSAGIAGSVLHAPLSPARLATLVQQIETDYMARCAGRVAEQDYPLAALTYLHVRSDRQGFCLSRLDHADCFAEITSARRPSRHRPGFAMPAVAPYRPLDLSGARGEAMRARRLAQIRDCASTAVTLHPRSTATGTTARQILRGPARFIAGSDGLERYAAAYGLGPMADISALAAEGRALEALVRLRAWERANSAHQREVKTADDVLLLSGEIGSRAGSGLAALRRVERPGVTLWTSPPGGVSLRLGQGLHIGP